jgi:hypothetical protein
MGGEREREREREREGERELKAETCELGSVKKERGE